MFSSRFMLFPTFTQKFGVKKIPGGGGVWTVGIYIHYILYSLVLYLKCGGGLGGGGGCNVFLTFYAIYNISKKKTKFWEYKKIFFFRKTIISHLMFSSCFFSAGNIEKFPFTYWLNGRWFLQIVDIGNFNMRLEILKSAPSLTG